MIILKAILMMLLGGALWAWRGSKYTFGNFITAFLCSTGMVLGFNHFLGVGLSIGTLIGAIITLALVEMLLGYGSSAYFLNMKAGVKWVESLQKELWIFLALVSVAYCVLPALFLLEGPPMTYIIVALIGAILFPLAKFVSMKLDAKEVAFDTWKVAESIIGTGIILSWIVGNLVGKI